MMRWWRPNSSWSLPWSFDSPTHTPVVFYQLPHFWIHFPFLWPPVSKSLRGLTAQQSADTSSCYPCSLEWTWEIYQLGRFLWYSRGDRVHGAPCFVVLREKTCQLLSCRVWFQLTEGKESETTLLPEKWGEWQHPSDTYLWLVVRFFFLRRLW